MNDNDLPEPQEPQENNPLEQILGAMLGPEAAAEIARQMGSQGFDPASLSGLFGPGSGRMMPLGQLQHLFQSTTGPVNWRIVQEGAQQLAFQFGDPRLSAAQAEQVKQALTVADLWLDPVTDLSTRQTKREAWTRVEWVNHTLPGWKGVCEPVAANVSRALSDVIRHGGEEDSEFGLPPEMANLQGALSQAMPRLSGMMFGAQIGNALAALAKESFGSNDTGFPLVEPGTTALVLANVEAFADGLEIPANEVLQFLAVRECAHARLFSAVPWLTADLLQALQRYSSEIAIDADAIAEAAHSLDPQNPESLNAALSGGVFGAQPTEDQQRALQRLETMLALIEGWVEVVTSQAVSPYLPQADRLREMVRRRRVTGSTGEQMLAQLVGLQLRPRRARDAALLFQTVQLELGSAGRDALWSHPDQAPTAEELADPVNFLASRADKGAEPDEFDAELEQLLSGTLGWAKGLGPENAGPDSNGRDGEDPDGVDPRD